MRNCILYQISHKDAKFKPDGADNFYPKEIGPFEWGIYHISMKDVTARASTNYVSHKKNFSVIKVLEERIVYQLNGIMYRLPFYSRTGAISMPEDSK